MDIDPETHMYDCPGTLPGGRGWDTCKSWEGRSFADIRAGFAGVPLSVPVPRSAPRTPEPARAFHQSTTASAWTARAVSAQVTARTTTTGWLCSRVWVLAHIP